MKHLLCTLLVCCSMVMSAQTFYRQYGNSAVNEGGQCVIASSDGNMFVGGFKDDSAMVLKVDMQGNILWSRVFKPVPGLASVVGQLEVSPDGFLVGIGNAFDPSVLRYRDGYFFKMDLAGNLIWINRINDSREIHFESLHTFSSTQYRLFMTVYDMASSTWADPASVLIDAATGGVISTTPRFNHTAIPYLDDEIATVINPAGNRFYSTGRVYVNGAAANSMRIFLTKYDLSGSLLASCYLLYNAAASSRLYGSDIAYHNDSVAISYFGDISGSSGNFSVGLIRADTNGNVAWARNYNITASASEMSYRVLPHANGYFVMGFTQSGGSDFFILSTDRNGNLLWQRSYGGATSTESLRELYTPFATIIGTNIYFTGQSSTSGNFNLVLASVDFNGNISCLSPGTLSVNTLNNPLNRTLLSPTNVAFTTNYSAPAVNPGPQPISDICYSVSLNLGNDTSVCSGIVLNATLPSATSYLWSTGATTPTLTVAAPGTYWATVMVNCCSYSDTIVISSGILPTATFSWANANCTGTVSFTNSSLNSSAYLWNYGDNTTGTGVSQSHLYVSPGSYTVMLIASNNCGSDTISSLVSVPNAIAVSATPQVITTCPAEPIPLSATATGGQGNFTYSWNPGGSGATITVSPVSASTFVVTATDSAGCTGTDTISVNIIPPVVLSASADTAICIGQSVTISASASNNGPFTWNSVTGNPQSLTVAPLVTTTYFVFVVDTCSGDTLTDSVVVTVNQLPVSQFTATGPDCFGVVTFANGSGNFNSSNWDFGDQSTDTLTSPTHQYAGSGSYNVMLVTGNNCGNDTAVATVIVPPPINLSVVPDSISICPGAPTNLSATASGGTGLFSYNWTPGGAGSTIVVSPMSPTTYIVTATDSLGCSGSDTAYISILPAITLSASSDTTICAGQTITLSANASNGGPFTWSTSTATTNTITVTPSITTTYYVAVTDTCSGATVTDSIVVQVDPVPTAQFSFSGPDCQGNALFTNTSSNALVYLWDFGDNSSSSAASPSHQYLPGTYVITLVAQNACGTDTFLQNITASLLVATVNPSTAVVCTGDSLTLSASVSGGIGTVSYLWNPGSMIAPVITVTPQSNATYSVTVTDSLGCTSSDSVVVTISTPVTLNATGSATICSGASTTITASASNGGPYTWSNNLGNSPGVTVSPTVTTTYYVTVFDSCSGNLIVDSVTVFIMPPSIVAFSVDSTSGCAPLTVYFTDLSTTGQDQIATWMWYFGDGDSSGATSPSHTYLTPGSYSVTLTIVTTSGCVTTLVNGAVIDVYPVPVAGFSWEQTGSIGDEPEVQFTDESLGATTWMWNFGDSTTSMTPDPFHTYPQTGNFFAMQIVGNNYGCYDTAIADLELTGQFTLYVPNAFTPGIGMYNNTFGGIGTGIVDYHLMVFDRWGMLLFESYDYNLQWDGRYRGNLVQVDTYAWVIVAKDYTGMEHRLYGHVNVIR